MRRIPYFVFLSVALLWGCSDEEKPFRPGNQPRLNITDAAGIVVYKNPSGAGGRIATEGTNLYKITTDGNVESVKFVDADGQNLDPNASGVSINVKRAYDAGDFIVLDGEFVAWDTLGNYQDYYNLLIRKSDGAVFEIRSSTSRRDINSDLGELQEVNFQSDKDGNLYYVNNEGKIMKVDVSNPSDLFIMEYLPTGQTTFYFIVDRDGNCVYEYGEDYRLRKGPGGIFEFQSGEPDPSEFWVGSNGMMYFTSYDHDNGVPTIGQLNVNGNGEVSSTELWAAPGFNEGFGVQNTNHNYYYRIVRQNSIVFIAFENGSHWEFSEGNNQVINFELPDLSLSTKVTYSDDYYYLAEGTNLYKVSFADHNYSSILTPGEYEVYTMSVNNDEILQINALRFSDGRKIIAEINAQGEFNVIDEEQDKEALYLQRLN